jgi:hypothetical protein
MVLVVGIGACILPTDRSSELAVELEALPNLFIKDTLQLRARLVDEAGKFIPNALIRYVSDDVTVVNVTADSLLLAVGVGTTTVTATAVGYDEAAVATRTAQVRGLLEIDSIRNTNQNRLPSTAWFGDVLEIFGVGLSPDSIFTVTVGGVQAPINGYVPSDPSQPNRLGRLFVWAPPPAERQSQMFVLGFNGGLLVPDTLNIVQRDLHEFNDTLPADLGAVPLGFRNPALAFEARVRTEAEAAVDWYTFTNADTANRTIAVFSEMVGAETFVTLVTDSLFWDGSIFDFGFGSRAWTIGRETYLCDGLQVTFLGEPEPFAEVPFPFTIVALADLPPGTYHIFVPYVPQGEPASYEILILPAYFSIGSVPRDTEEENDYCGAAGPLPVGGASLTIDNPHDIDWYQFTVGSGQILDVTAITDGTAEADLDMYLIRDFRPDSLVLVNAATTAGDADENITQFLPAGDYFLVVFDFAGMPTGYLLDAAFSLTPSGAALTAAPTAEIGALRAKRERGKKTPPPAVTIPEVLRSWWP